MQIVNSKCIFLNIWALGARRLGGLASRVRPLHADMFALASATLSIASESHSDIAKCVAPPASCSMRMYSLLHIPPDAMA